MGKKDYYDGAISINKEKSSPYWMVSFTGADGKRKRRSTRVPVGGGVFEGDRISAKLAERLAFKIGLQIALADKVAYESENNVSVRAFCDGVIRKRLSGWSEETLRNARTALKHFYRYLKGRANEPMRLLVRGDIEGFVLWRRRDVRAETVRKDFTAIKACLKEARIAKVVRDDLCLGVGVPRDSGGERTYKEAFSLEEIRLLVERLPDEWSSAVRCCFETYGQRLGDIIALDWNQFDWDNRVVRFVTGKTGRVLVQPMRVGFYDWARGRWQSAGCPSEGLLHPSLFRKGASGASSEFSAMVRVLGMGRESGVQVGSRRKMYSKTFHCIRATVATLLHEGGVSEAVAMELVGHESDSVHRVYVKPSAESLRRVAEGLPGV